MIKEGSNSAELLLPKFISLFDSAIKNESIVIVDLDGVAGYGAAFLDELFSTLVRSFDYKKLMDTLVIISDEEPYLIDEIYGYMKETYLSQTAAISDY